MRKKTRKDIICELLADYSKGLHVSSIATELIQKNLVPPSSEQELVQKISRDLSLDIKKYKIKSRFRRVPNNRGGYKQGWYRLKKQKRSLVDVAIEKIAQGTKVEIPNIPSLYTGKAGEYAVLSELLFNEFNASLMLVDQGIDVVASKGEDFFHIQVKTANNRSGAFFSSISKKQFERFNKAKTFYIFVLRYFLNSAVRSDFVILSTFEIEKFIATGVIKNGDSLNLSISIDKGKIFLNNKEDISYHFNLFSSIK